MAVQQILRRGVESQARLAVVWTVLTAVGMSVPMVAVPVPQTNASTPQQASSGQPQTPAAASPMTNAEIIRMVKAGVPESAILSTIQSSRGQFDLSPDGLLALHRSGVSQKVLETMTANRSAPSGSSVSATSPGAGSNHVSPPAGGSAPIPKADLASPTIRVHVRNPQAAQANAATIDLLQKQRSLGDAEAARITTAAPAQAQFENRAQPSQALLTAGATQTPLPAALNKVQSPAPSAQTQKNRLATAAVAATPRSSSTPTIEAGQTLAAANAAGNSSPALLSPSQGGLLAAGSSPQSGSGLLLAGAPASSQGGSTGGCAGATGGACGGSSTQAQGVNGGGGMPQAISTGGNFKGAISPSMTHVENMDSTALLCTNDPQFRILSVSGSSYPATFTPIDQYNLYTINGCSFGDPGANDKVYIYGAGSFQGNFNIKFWSDNLVVVSLDESITGVPDLSNLTLVVQRNDGQQAQQGGFKFYAARAVVPLKWFPSQWATLATLTTTDSFGGNGGNLTMPTQFSSPPSSEYPSPGPSAGTLFVSRSYNGAKFPPAKAFDWYSFKGLAPGFSTSDFQLTTYPQVCPGVVTYEQSFGIWNGYFGQLEPGDLGDRSQNPNDIYIDLSDTTCSGFTASAFFLPFAGAYGDLTGSYYSLQVWVEGPSGIDPFTGQ